jgi:hypothetical protein
MLNTLTSEETCRGVGSCTLIFAGSREGIRIRGDSHPRELPSAGTCRGIKYTLSHSKGKRWGLPSHQSILKMVISFYLVIYQGLLSAWD